MLVFLSSWLWMWCGWLFRVPTLTSLQWWTRTWHWEPNKPFLPTAVFFFFSRCFLAATGMKLRQGWWHWAQSDNLRFDLKCLLNRAYKAYFVGKEAFHWFWILDCECLWGTIIQPVSLGSKGKNKEGETEGGSWWMGDQRITQTVQTSVGSCPKPLTQRKPFTAASSFTGETSIFTH